MESNPQQLEEHKIEIVEASTGDDVWRTPEIVRSRAQELRRRSGAPEQNYRTIGEHHQHNAQRQPYVSESVCAQR